MALGRGYPICNIVLSHFYEINMFNVLKREYYAWFRKRRPYTSTNHLGQDTQLLNVARVARVWLGTMFYNFIFDVYHILFAHWVQDVNIFTFICS